VRTRRAGPGTFGAWAGTAVVSCGLVSVFFAGSHVTSAAAAKRACTTRPATAPGAAAALSTRQDGATALSASASDISRSAPHKAGLGKAAKQSQGSSTRGALSPGTKHSHSPSPSPSPGKSTPGPTKSPTPSPAPTLSTSPDPKPSSLSPSPTRSGPSPSKSPKPTKSPTTSPSPTKSPKPSKSPTTSPSPSPTKTPANSQLCVSVQPFSSRAQIRRSHVVTYTVWVWSTHGSTKNVTVSAAVQQTHGTAAPQFSVCPDASGATCALGNLPQGQADELHVRVAVRKDATIGHNVTLVAQAKAKNAASFSASASVRIVPRRKPDPAATTPPPSTSPLPPLPTIPAPALPDPLSSTGKNASGLFPTVSPQATAGPAARGTAAGHKNTRRIRATSVSATLPLNMRLIGGQLAGLVVLAAAIAIAITRLSLRPQRPQDGDGPSGKE
jgi:hypothetical protein